MNQFSIILPVHNGGRYVKECINSILAQTYSHFNLIVLDNNSIDGTKEWIESLNNEKIIIYHSTKDLNIVENWSRAVDIHKNKFMTLIGHDDILYPNYLSTINQLIIEYPTASLYQTHFNYIDKDGKIIRKCKPMQTIQNVNEFLGSCLDNNIDIIGTGFMFRSKDYDAIGGIPKYPNLLFADFELFLNLSKISHKVTAPQECFAFRLHQSTTTISQDIVFQNAFAQFVGFLKKSANENTEIDKIVKRDGVKFIQFYAQALSHRLLRTSKSKRKGQSVNMVLQNCKQYANDLAPGNNCNLSENKSIKFAKFIDSNSFTRALFVIFKKLYSKPIL